MLWDTVTVPLGIEKSLKNIFSAVITGGINREDQRFKELLDKKLLVAQQCRPSFAADFPHNIFSDCYAILYEVISSLQTPEFDADMLTIIIDNNRDLILESPYVNKNKYSRSINNTIASDDDIVNAVIRDLMDVFNDISLNPVTVDEYKSSVNTYTSWYQNALAEYTAHGMAAIMTDEGYDEKLTGKRVRHYHGLNDLKEYYANNMRIINELSEESKIHNTVIDVDWWNEDMQNSDSDDSGELFSLGIKEMDATIGKLRRGNMLGIMGPPKGGKTRFSAYLVARALLHGYNVAVWPLEGTKQEWISMIIASYIAQISYEETKNGKKDGMLRISSGDILRKKYNKTPSLAREINAAKQTIATNPRIGRLSFIEGTAYVEDMFEVIKGHYDNDNRFDVLVIDQLVNVMSKKSRGKVERISEAYMGTKNFLANELPVPALGLMPAQLKQDVVDQLRSGKIDIIDVTAGGESSETVRTPDEVIGLFSSKEERASNIMKFFSVASRHNENFEDFQGRGFLGCCFFSSEDDEISNS